MLGLFTGLPLLFLSLLAGQPLGFLAAAFLCLAGQSFLFGLPVLGFPLAGLSLAGDPLGFLLLLTLQPFRLRLLSSQPLLFRLVLPGQSHLLLLLLTGEPFGFFLPQAGQTLLLLLKGAQNQFSDLHKGPFLLHFRHLGQGAAGGNHRLVLLDLRNVFPEAGAQGHPEDAQALLLRCPEQGRQFPARHEVGSQEVCAHQQQGHAGARQRLLNLLPP